MFKIPNISRNKLGLITTAIMGLGSVLNLSAVANASTLNVEFTNVGPPNGMGIAQFWIGVHDGSFDLFNSGETASREIEILAEDGFIGLEGRVPGVVEIIEATGVNLEAVSPELRAAIDAGVDLNEFIPDNSIASLFAQSSAGANGGVQDILFPFSTTPRFFVLLRSGESISQTIKVEARLTNRFFSYAAMLFPTNDGFIANDDPQGIEIFDEQGNFIGADFTVFGDQVWDGGTEVNDEEQTSIPFTPPIFGLSVDEGGVIHPFPSNSIKLPGEGGFVDFEFNGEKLFENADFSRPLPSNGLQLPGAGELAQANVSGSNYPLVRVTVTQVSTPEPASIKGLLAVGGMLCLSRCLRFFKLKHRK